MNTESPNSVNPSVWNTPEKPFDYYSTNFDVYDADVMCDGCKSVFEWTDKEADSGDDIPICSVVCYNSYYDVEEEEERYCDNEVCPYGGYIYDEELEKYKGKEYVCVGCETGKGLQEREQEDKYFNDRVSAGDAKCEDCGKWDKASNCDYDDDTGLHTNCRDAEEAECDCMGCDFNLEEGCDKSQPPINE